MPRIVCSQERSVLYARECGWDRAEALTASVGKGHTRVTQDWRLADGTESLVICARDMFREARRRIAR